VCGLQTKRASRKTLKEVILSEPALSTPARLSAGLSKGRTSLSS